MASVQDQQVNVIGLLQGGAAHAYIIDVNVDWSLLAEGVVRIEDESPRKLIHDVVGWFVFDQKWWNSRSHHHLDFFLIIPQKMLQYIFSLQIGLAVEVLRAEIYLWFRCPNYQPIDGYLLVLIDSDNHSHPYLSRNNV